MFICFDVVGAEVLAGASVRAVFATLLGPSTMTCAIFPLGFALTTQMCARCTHLRGWKGIVFVLFVGVVLFLWYGLWVIAGALLLSLAQEDIFAFVVLCLASVAFFLLTFVVFRRPPGQQRRRRTGAVTETIEELAEALGSYIQQIGGLDVR